MDVTQKLRRCFTLPVFFAAVALHFWLWVRWLGYGMRFQTFMRWEELAVAVVVVIAVTEWSMNGPNDGNKQRGFDVLPKD